MKYLWISLLLSCVSGALTATVCCLFLVRRLLKPFSIRPSAQLSHEVIQLRSDLDSILVTVKRLNAKYGMRAVRGHRKEAESSSVDVLPGETRAQWKLRMMKKHFGRNADEQEE